MVRQRISEALVTPVCYIGERNAGIYNAPYIKGPCLVIPLWPWLAKVFQWLHIPIVV